jgi:hypothetical protein
MRAVREGIQAQGLLAKILRPAVQVDRLGESTGGKVKIIRILVLAAWYVVTYSGQPVAGPFSQLNDCTAMAQYMSQHYQNISTVCQSR